MLRFALLAVTLIGFAAAARADDAVPSWMKIDGGQKTVTLDMVAGWNPNNGALNFNGYYSGNMTVVVPPGWMVKVATMNHDGMLPHSLLVSKSYAEGDTPVQLDTQQVAISKAYTGDPIGGLAPNEKDSLSFRAPVGKNDFWFVCGVPGHALQGMYVNLRIDPTATAPAVIVGDAKEPGRP